MLIIFGDSHARFSFYDLSIPHINHSESSYTMNRVARDSSIPHYRVDYDISNNIILLAFGEIDCRCQIHKQRLLGRDEDEIIKTLAESYINSIQSNIKNAKIIIVAVIPPTRQEDYESLHGPITHQFPFIGTNEDRVRYTMKLNSRLSELCSTHSLQYFDPYSSYKNTDGTLDFKYTDKIVHIGYGMNINILNSLYELI
jgi:hypothetical protein